MKANLKNDWYVLRFIPLIMIFFSGVLTLMGTRFEYSGFTGSVLPMVYTACTPIILFINDERSKWARTAAALPGNRRNYIHSKFISGIICFIYVIVISLGFYVLKDFLTGRNEVIEQLPFFMLGFAASVFMFSVFLPIIVLFGVKGGTVAFFILVTLYSVVVGYIEAMIEDGESAMPDIYFSLPYIGVSAVIFILSWLISLLIFKHKDL